MSVATVRKIASYGFYSSRAQGSAMTTINPTESIYRNSDNRDSQQSSPHSAYRFACRSLLGITPQLPVLGSACYGQGNNECYCTLCCVRRSERIATSRLDTGPPSVGLLFRLGTYATDLVFVNVECLLELLPSKYKHPFDLIDERRETQ